MLISNGPIKQKTKIINKTNINFKRLISLNKLKKNKLIKTLHNIIMYNKKEILTNENKIIIKNTKIINNHYKTIQ